MTPLLLVQGYRSMNTSTYIQFVKQSTRTSVMNTNCAAPVAESLHSPPTAASDRDLNSLATLAHRPGPDSHTRALEPQLSSSTEAQHCEPALKLRAVEISNGEHVQVPTLLTTCATSCNVSGTCELRTDSPWSDTSWSSSDGSATLRCQDDEKIGRAHV